MNIKGNQNNHKEEQSQRSHKFQFQNLLNSYKNQDSMILVLRQKQKPMEKNYDFRNKPLNLRSTNFDKGAQTIQWGEGSLQINGARTNEYLHAKE